MLPLAISVGASVFPHDGDSYETLLATADSRMYRDKTRRKREMHGIDPRARTPHDETVSDTELARAAVGVL
jgi:GGDEF domain-containing protein